MRSMFSVNLALATAVGATHSHAEHIDPVVEVEETVYEYTPADNGAGPMWCHGSTSIVRMGNRVFVTGLETLDTAAPLNNCRWFLMERTKAGWERIHTDSGRTREPSPVAAFDDGRLLVSANPTLATDPKQYAGPSEPAVFQFSTDSKDRSPTELKPRWEGSPRFSEHSYRSFAADRSATSLVLFQNIGHTHAEWSFLDPSGDWSAMGKLKWPFGEDYPEPQPIRICYPNVAITGSAVFFCGVSDIQEPNPEWRAFKRELTGRKWDYDFRRLFFTWTPDIAKQSFHDWIEVSSREETAGWISPGDLWLAPNGDVHILWTERAIDERLRETFFPDAKQSHGLYHAVIRGGEVASRTALVLAEEGGNQAIPGRGRFHETSDGKLLVICAVNKRTATGREHQNWLIPLLPEQNDGQPVLLPLDRAFTDFFVATPRAGSTKGNLIDMFGVQSGLKNTMSYARLRLE